MNGTLIRVESDLHDEAWYARWIAQARWSRRISVRGCQRVQGRRRPAAGKPGKSCRWSRGCSRRAAWRRRSDSDDCSHGCSVRQSSLGRRGAGARPAVRRALRDAGVRARALRPPRTGSGRCRARRAAVRAGVRSHRASGQAQGASARHSQSHRRPRRADLDRSGRLAPEREGRRLPPVRSRSLRRRRPGAERNTCCAHDQVDVDATASRAPRQAQPSRFRRRDGRAVARRRSGRIAAASEVLDDDGALLRVTVSSAVSSRITCPYTTSARCLPKPQLRQREQPSTKSSQACVGGFAGGSPGWFSAPVLWSRPPRRSRS